MPRSLVSYWKRVATSGPTADRREITPQELRDIAETYKPSYYTAVIWADHERWPGSHGTVFAVRLVEPKDDPELEEGQVALEAQLKPNDKLLWLNDRGEKLFTSIEITPNFANSGRAYLTGLAVTDEPASLGTQELYFSKRSSAAAYYAASVELGPLRNDVPAAEGLGLINALTSLFKRFANEAPATPSPTTESKPPMDEATATALKALLVQLLTVAAGIQAVIEPAAAEAPEPEQEPIDDVTAAVDEIVTTAEKDRDFKRTKIANQDLAERFTALEEQMTKLLNTAQGRKVPRTTAPVNEPAKRVL
ncbi:GPO family capsid scaffolding protein [Pseudomonas tohonis]|uniref:GPO family capsid scaffolding protein n=1 Tax=Pseudomonas tohonis TaxID=2725477 RepID=UPI0022F11E2A|nr:GPO family capsid scaffolding protein [Pseudomonas tohonis]